VSFCLALLPCYVVLALVLLQIMGLEMHFGMHPCLTFSEVLFGTYGADETCAADSLRGSPSQHCTDSPSPPFAPG
jgi:hypothetical protein